MSQPPNVLEFVVHGREALFTDPVTKLGGDKCSYHVPTYESLKGVAKSIYWKPTIIWVIDSVRVMRRIRTHSRNMKPLNIDGIYPSQRNPATKEAAPNTLAIYTFLTDVEYQVRAHFDWNDHRPELEADRNLTKHAAIAQRSLKMGGRQDIFLGTRDCQAYVEPCGFGSGPGFHDDGGDLGFGLMFHGFDYPDETGVNKLYTRMWNPVMKNGRIDFVRPENCRVRKFVRDMAPKKFGLGVNARSADAEAADLDIEER